MEDRRITRLNELTWGLYQKYPFDDVSPVEFAEDFADEAERSICRAAAEISGLTAEMIDEAARDAFRASTAVALCCFAKLAADDE